MQSRAVMIRSLFAIAALCDSSSRSFAFAGIATNESGGFTGRWVLEKMLIGPEHKDFPLLAKFPDSTISMKITETAADTFTLRAKVINALTFTARVVDGSGENSEQTLRVTAGMSTKMGGPLEEMETETALVRGLSDANEWYEHDERLIVKGPSAELTFVRAPETRESSQAPQQHLLHTTQASDMTLVGRWVLNRMSVGPELIDFPLAEELPDTKVSMSVEESGPNAFKLQTKAINLKSFKVLVSEESAAMKPFDNIIVTPGMSTRVGGPTAQMQAESAFADGLASADRWYEHDGELLIVGPTVELAFIRASDDEDSIAASRGRQLSGEPATTALADHDRFRLALRTKLAELRIARKLLVAQGEDSVQIAARTRSLLEEVRALKQRAGPAVFDEVRALPLPSLDLKGSAYTSNSPVMHV